MAVPYRFLNKRVPITDYHIDANKINSNFDSITESGEAFGDNKIISENNLKDSAIEALVFGIKYIVDNYDDLTTDNIYQNTISIVKNESNGNKAGYYVYNGTDWEFVLDLVPLHHVKHEHGGEDEIDLSDLRGNTININSIVENTEDTGVTIEGILHKDGRLFVPTPVDDDEPTPKKYVEEYVQQYVQGLDYQDSVKDKDLTSPPQSPANKDRYLLYNEPDAGTDWEGHKNDIAEYTTDTLQWIFITPNKGFTLEVEDENTYYNFNGVEWIKLSSTIQHNNTTGIQGGQEGEYYHFTEQEHENILSHLENTDIHFLKSDIKHSDIQDDEPEKHRVIDDNNISDITLYSSQKIEERLATKADDKDYPLKWQIINFIQDGSVIDQSPSSNGYTTIGEIYAISDTGNIYNGNVYRVSDSDTWELLEERSEGLGVLRSVDLKEYYFSSDDANGYWNNYLNNYQSYVGRTYFDNLLKNGEMEFWIDSNTPKNWRVTDDGSSGSYTVSQESSIVRYGKYSLKIDITTAFTTWGINVYQVDDDGATPITTSTHGIVDQWRFKARVYAPNQYSIFLSVDVKINGTWNYDYLKSAKNRLTNQWEDLSLIFTSGSDWEEIVFKFRIDANVTGSYYIDTGFAYQGYVDVGYMGRSSDGKSKFTELIDTPDDYSGQAGKVVKVKADESGVEFGDVNTADEKVKVDSEDAEAGYLTDKLIFASFDDNNNIPSGIFINTIDVNSIKKRAIKSRVNADYVVETVAEADAALDDMGNKGIGGHLVFSQGIYDKGSAFEIPSVDNVELSGVGTIIRPALDDAIKCRQDNAFYNLKIHGLHFEGKDSGNYGFINIQGSYTRDTFIYDNYFSNNYGYYIYSQGFNQYFWYVNIINNIFNLYYLPAGTPSYTSTFIYAQNMTGSVIESNVFTVSTPTVSYVKYIKTDGTATNGGAMHLKIIDNKFNIIGDNTEFINGDFWLEFNNDSQTYSNRYLLLDNNLFFEQGTRTYNTLVDVGSISVYILSNNKSFLDSTGKSFTNGTDDGTNKRLINNTMIQI